MASKFKDTFSNKAYGSVTESGANTLTYSEIQTNVNVFDKVGWIVNRIEWYIPDATLGLLTTGGDGFDVALTATNSLTSLSLSSPGVIDLLSIEVQAFGTAGNMHVHDFPLIRDFSNLPGGGLLIAPRPLYVAMVGDSLGSAGTAEARISFQQIELKADEYIELVDFYRIVGS